MCVPDALVEREPRSDQYFGAGRATADDARFADTEGGVMSYGPNLPDLFRRAGDDVDKIFAGLSPPTCRSSSQPDFELIINLTTAKALGLTIPELFLLRADEVMD